MARPERVRLGDLLIQQKLISAEQLQFALDEQKSNGRKLGRVLADNGFISEEQMSEMLARQFHIPYVNLKNHALNLDLVRQLPESEARRFRALLLEEDRKGALLVGMADPTDLAAFDELGQTLKRTIEAAVVTEGQLLETIERVYRRTEELSGLARDITEEAGQYVVRFGAAADNIGVEEMPALNLFKSLIREGVQAKASAIHLDLQEGRLHIHLRAEGQLRPRSGADAKMGLALLHCIKQISGLDTAEKRLPQDGHLGMQVNGKALDVLVSALPVHNGESLTLRMANLGEHPLSLEAQGLPAEMAAHLREIMARGRGMLLVADLTGQASAATLYAALAETQATHRKIITVEDPVEYALPGIAQIQAHPSAGLNLHRALCAALRQQPDVALIGDLPDQETALTGLRAAMSGRLVLAGLHARDAADAFHVLANMGVPPYLVASALQLVLATRTLRRICAGCVQPHKPSARETAWLGQAGVAPERWGGLRLGRGCARCGGTGYSGHLAVYEMLELDQDLAEAAANGDASRLLHTAQAQLLGHTLFDHALAQMEQGRTTVAEAMRLGARKEG